VSGQVTAPDGRPVAGATVAACGASTQTDAGGLYTLGGVATGSRVVVSFSKPGSAATLGVVEIPKPRPRAEAPTAPTATLHRVLVPTGAVAEIDAASGGSVEVEGLRVTFPAGSIHARGTVHVALTPIDVTGRSLGALPGDFRVRRRPRGDAHLETWGALDVTLTQAGRPVLLGLPARIEVPLPPSSPFSPGDRIPLWSFRGKGGSWRRFPLATAVGESTVREDRLAAFGLVSRPGWWSVGDEIETACLCGGVADAQGLPAAGAAVTARGLDDHAVTAATSGEDGSYCVRVRRDARVSVTASLVADGLRLDSAPEELVTPASGTHRRRGGCAAGPDLSLPEVSCVWGRTLDELGEPRPGVPVATSAGSAQASDGEGRFCLAAPADQRVTVFGEGYLPAAVETLPGAATCPVGCAAVDLHPAGPPPGACLTGRVLDWRTGEPTADVSVSALHPDTGTPFGPAVRPDLTAFLYRLVGLPFGTAVEIVAVGSACEGHLLFETGSDPTCRSVPDVTCGPR
jgi:hypothetical protein